MDALKRPIRALVGLGFMLLVLLTSLWLQDQEILIESLESKTLTGGNIYNKIKLIQRNDKDIWMMNQGHHGLEAERDKWDRLAIVVDRSKSPKTARFYQFAPGDLEWKENLPEVAPKVSCYLCHSNGPRAIRPRLDSLPLKNLERAKIFWWNAKIKFYGRVQLHSDHDQKDKQSAVPVRFRGPSDNELLRVKTCAKCHREEGFWARAKLVRQNLIAIKFMYDQGFMPPFGHSLSKSEKLELERFIKGF